MDNIFTARGLFFGSLLEGVEIGLSLFVVGYVYMEIWING